MKTLLSILTILLLTASTLLAQAPTFQSTWEGPGSGQIPFGGPIRSSSSNGADGLQID